MGNLHIQYLPYQQIGQRAEEFLLRYHPSRLLPVPIEEIVEFKLGVDIVPIPNLGDPKVMRGGKEVDKFNPTWHTRCWRYFKVRPPGGSSYPEQTDTKYCIYDKRHNDYGYTEEWVKLLLEKFRDEKAYEEMWAILRGVAT